MTFFVLFIKQYFRLIQWFLFLSFLIGQPKSKVVHTNIISESEKMEATFIFDEVIDRDDVSGWIDRNNYFTLSMFNVSFDSKQTLNKELKYPLVSIETADTDESVQIIFHTAREIDSYQLIRHSKGKNVLIVLNYLDKEKKLKKEDGELVQSFIVEELPDTFDVMKDRWRHPKTWKDARERSSIRILCDTEGLPIYVDNQLVGKSPYNQSVIINKTEDLNESHSIDEEDNLFLGKIKNVNIINAYQNSLEGVFSDNQPNYNYKKNLDA